LIKQQKDDPKLKNVSGKVELTVYGVGKNHQHSKQDNANGHHQSLAKAVDIQATQRVPAPCHQQKNMERDWDMLQRHTDRSAGLVKASYGTAVKKMKIRACDGIWNMEYMYAQISE